MPHPWPPTRNPSVSDYFDWKPDALKNDLHQMLQYDRPPDLVPHRLNSPVFMRHVCNSFCGFLHDRLGLGWVPAWFLTERMDHYWNWRNHPPDKARSLFRLNRKEMELFLVKGCRGFFWIDGPRRLSTIQSFAFFADYLLAQNGLSAAEVEQIKQDCAAMFELGRKTVDASDPAYRLYPTFAALYAAEHAKQRGSSL